MVSVLHKGQEFKLEKLKYKKLDGGHASNPNFQLVNKLSQISQTKIYSRDWLIQSII